MVANNDKNRTYSVSYVPKVAGLHKVRDLLPMHFALVACRLDYFPGASNQICSQGVVFDPGLCLDQIRMSP